MPYFRDEKTEYKMQALNDAHIIKRFQGLKSKKHKEKC